VKLFKEPDKALRTLFTMGEGDIFDVSKVRKGLENMRKVYGQYGYINFVATPDTEINDTDHTIDMVFNIEEDKQFTVRRIDFSGNTTTRDKVIRRELLLQEGSLFNSQLWELSILRLNQLDYFEKLDPKDSDVQPNNRDGTVDINLKVKEKGKNAIGFTGGVSGLSGSFVGFNYQTNNFLGQGETLTLDAQLGSLERNIVLGITHPYAFDRPLQVGFTVYSNRFNYDQAQQASILAGQDLRQIFNLVGADNIQNYRQSSYGFTTFASYPLHNNFTRVGLSYGYDISNIKTFSEASQLLFQDLNFNGLGGPNSLDGIKTSKIIPSYNYSTVNNPMTPTRGTGISATLELAGLAGNVRMWRPTIDYRWFHPAGGNRVWGMHLLGSTMSGYGGRLIPPFMRFYTGGETDIRGFDFFTISPIVFIPDTATMTVLNSDGSARTTTGLNNIGQEAQQGQTMTVPLNRITFPGGDTKVIGNFEYRIPIIGPVTLALFGDLGLNTALMKSQLQLTDQRLQDLRTQFPDVTFQQKLAVAKGTNSQWRMSTGIELQVVLPVVNAPFRVYWAYNPLRLNTNISTVPLANPSLFPNSATYQSYIANFGSTQPYSEPARTIRFTIGRTF
jgi:outer membrane protein insertion porin family